MVRDWNSRSMILPGISGGYLLLLLGQYETILGTVDQLKRGLLGSGGPDMALVLDAMTTVVPLGLGIVAFGDDDLSGEQAVLEGVAAGSGLALGRFGAGGFLGVFDVGMALFY